MFSLMIKRIVDERGDKHSPVWKHQAPTQIIKDAWRLSMVPAPGLCSSKMIWRLLRLVLSRHTAMLFARENCFLTTIGFGLWSVCDRDSPLLPVIYHTQSRGRAATTWWSQSDHAKERYLWHSDLCNQISSGTDRLKPIGNIGVLVYGF